MDVAVAHFIVSGITYRPKWKFSLQLNEAQQAAIRIIIQVPHSTRPGQTFSALYVGAPFAFDTIDTKEDLLLMVHRTVQRFNSHEILEELKIDGVQIWKPHHNGRVYREPDHDIYYETLRGRV